jgi:NAD(P)-dependent dehydrogenase (short-subunit alcohol dehydrogenase family)
MKVFSPALTYYYLYKGSNIMSVKPKKIAIVTGATSGIGKATVQLLNERSWVVVATGRDQVALDELKSDGLADLIVKADLSDKAQVESLISQTIAKFGQIDSLVHAAGILTGGGLDNETDEGFNRLMDVNVTSSWRLLKAAWEPLKSSKGSALLVSSVTGLRAFPGLLGYCVSKAAVDQLVRCAALDGAPYGVRVNGVNPGVVVTNLHKNGGMDEETYIGFLEHSKETHPLGRVGQPEEIAEAIEWLISDKCGWTTGVSFPIDGGRQLTCNR